MGFCTMVPNLEDCIHHKQMAQGGFINTGFPDTISIDALLVRDRNAHKPIQHKLFAPYPKTPHFGPPEKSLCASFPGKEHKKGTHINSFGWLGGQKGGPKQAIVGEKKFSFFLVFSCPYFGMIRWGHSWYSKSRKSKGQEGHCCVLGVHTNHDMQQHAS